MATSPARAVRARDGVLAAACLAGFGALAVTLHPRPGRLDAAVLDWFVDHRTAWLTQAAKAITTVGSPTGMLVLAFLISLALARRHAVRPWLPFVVAVLTNVVENRMKGAFGRDRPPVDVRLLHESSFAFPSGHATMSMAVLGMLAVLAPRLAGRRDVGAARAGLVAGALVVGLTRLYLGVHWLSDVAGGALLGGAVALLVAVLTAGDPVPPAGAPAQPLGSRG